MRRVLVVDILRYRAWTRSMFAPRERLLPGIGYRLARRPRLAAGVLIGLRRIPGRRIRPVVYRYLSRPLIQRMRAHLVVPVAGGARMRVDTSDQLGRLLAASGVWEPHVTAAFSRILAPGDVCVDVGAHIGYYTLLASKLVGPTGRVYALEPNGATYQELCSNLALNAVSNVTALPVAAGASDGHARLIGPPLGNTGVSSIQRAEATDPSLDPAAESTVAVRAVSSLLDASDAARLSLVKIDVEGYEAEVLRGLEPLLLSGCRPALVLELHPGRSEGVDVLEQLSATFGMTAYELMRNHSLDRLAPVAPPREVVRLSELVSHCPRRTVNVLIAPRASGFVDRRRA